MKICEYGCGQEAKHQFKNGKWCCSKSQNSCPEMRTINRIKLIGNKNPMFGKKHSADAKLKMKLLKKGENNPFFNKKHSAETKQKISETQIGHIVSYKTRKKLSLYNTYSIEDWKKKYPLLFKIEEIREKNGKIQARCKNSKCENSKEKNGWFNIDGTSLSYRAIDIYSSYGNCRYFYCSDECKKECSLYNLKSDPNKNNDINNYYTQEEYNIWRTEVLKRAEYRCEYCGDTAGHAHHSKPQKLEPFFSLDPDYGIACCSKCHYKNGHREECSTGKLASIICK